MNLSERLFLRGAARAVAVFSQGGNPLFDTLCADPLFGGSTMRHCVVRPSRIVQRFSVFFVPPTHKQV